MQKTYGCLHCTHTHPTPFKTWCPDCGAKTYPIQLEENETIQQWKNKTGEHEFFLCIRIKPKQNIDDLINAIRIGGFWVKYDEGKIIATKAAKTKGEP